MHSNAVDPVALATVLDDARALRRAVAPPPDLAGCTLRDAYAIQDALVARRERSGERRSGWKLGITSPIKQQVMGIDHPLFGRLFATGVRACGSVIARDAFIAPRIEPEIAFGLAAPLEPGMDRDVLLRSIAWIAPALEITDGRYLPGKRTAVELVADNTAAAGYVLGERQPYDGAPVAAYPTELICNGEIRERGITADVLGDPIHALVLLAAHLAERGLRTAAGDIVLSGAITDAIPVEPGASVEARLAGLGSARIAFAPAG
jgi:2-keto-4-pentenoate hydratase